MQQSTTATRQGPLGIFYGWWLLGIGAIIVMVGSLQTGVTSVFFIPIKEELGLTSAALSLVFTVSRFEGGLEGPVVGWMIDKRGPRLPIIVGAALGGAGLLVLAQANSYLYFFVVYITMVSVGFQMGFLQCMHAVANLWFIRYRTRAMSVYSSSFRVGWAIFTPIVAVMVSNYGWRNTAVMLGVFVLATALPLSLLIRRSPESMGLLPDGARPAEPAEATAAQEAGEGRETPAQPPKADATITPVDMDFKASLKTTSFWIIAYSTTVRLSTQMALGVHAIPIFVWKGMGEQAGANLVGLTAGIAVPMILVLGWLGDKMSKKTILFIAQVALALGFIVLNISESAITLYLFIVLFAFGGNVSPVNYSILGEFYGRKVFARLRGALNSIGVIGGLTPWFAGLVFDATQSYSIVLITFSGLAAAAALLLLLVRNPQRKLRQKEVAAQVGT